MNGRLIQKNTAYTHVRLMKVISGMVALIILGTYGVYFTGGLSKYMTFLSINIWAVFAIGLLILGWYLAIKQRNAPYTKYSLVAILIVLVFSCRFMSPIPETAMMPLVIIILSVFYFDPALTLWVCVLCILGDVVVLKLMPVTMVPKNALAIRYITYIFCSLAAYNGALATRKVLFLAEDREDKAMKSNKLLLTEAEELQQGSLHLSTTSQNLLSIG